MTKKKFSQPIYSNIKTVKSSIKADHLAIIARSDNQNIVDHNKTRLTSTFRKPKPALNAAFLAEARFFSWDHIYQSQDIQEATDRFTQVSTCY